MSILSALGLLVTAAIRPKPDSRDAEIIAFKTQINDLTRERDDARFEVDRYRALARRWEERFQARQPSEVIYNQAQQALAQQYAQGQQYAAQNLCQPGQQGLAQSQSMQQMLGEQQYEGFCNCVPSRAQMWGLGGGLGN